MGSGGPGRGMSAAGGQGLGQGLPTSAWRASEECGQGLLWVPMSPAECSGSCACVSGEAGPTWSRACRPTLDEQRWGFALSPLLPGAEMRPVGGRQFRGQKATAPGTSASW